MLYNDRKCLYLGMMKQVHVFNSCAKGTPTSSFGICMLSFRLIYPLGVFELIMGHL